MQNLIRFLIRYHFSLLFILIEALSIFLLIQNNNYQKTKFVGFTRNIKGSFYQQSVKINNYFHLKEENEKLAKENVQLKNFIEKNLETRADSFKTVSDSVYNQQYRYIRADIINNSINKQHNYITIDKGSMDGIEREMGVISPNGIVGIISGVSKHFATAISVLNSELKISAQLKNSGHFGSLSWSGRDYRFVQLKDIPLHADINTGDTIVTSGYSAIFPEGIMIGFVEDYEERSGRFLEIEVKLSNDFKKLSNVYVVKNLLKEEQQFIEKTNQYD